MTRNPSIRSAATLALAVLSLATGHAADQAEAERMKHPIKVAVVNAVQWNNEPIGNIEVTYADGTQERWTTKGSCGQPRLAPDGTVGWTIFQPERPAQAASYPIRPNNTLVICRQGKVLYRLQAALRYIEDWGFFKDGKHFVVKNRALHGQATVKLAETQTGKVVHEIQASANPLPEWAAPYHD